VGVSWAYESSVPRLTAPAACIRKKEDTYEEVVISFQSTSEQDSSMLALVAQIVSCLHKCEPPEPVPWTCAL